VQKVIFSNPAILIKDPWLSVPISQ